MAARKSDFEVLAVFYDYSNERGIIVIDRSTLLRYLPDPALSSLAIYLKPGVDPDEARAGSRRRRRRRTICSSRPTRGCGETAIRVFDRTFAIT